MALLVGFIGGILGGVLGVYILNRYNSTAVSHKNQQVVLQESSAIIDVAKKLSPSVVSITTEQNAVDLFGRQASQNSDGTGIIIRGDGLILTNKHVIPDGVDKITVVTSDNKRYEGKVLARDPQLDLAYLKIEASGLRAAELGDSDQVETGQRVVAIGNALGEFENTVTSGIISGTGRPVVAGDRNATASTSENLQDLLQTDAAINPGNSGGPLVNVEGQVIGVNTAIAGDAQNIGFAIPINQAKPDIASIESSGKLSKPYVGVHYVGLTADIAKSHNLSLSDGAYLISSAGVPAVLPNTPAAKAGLKEGDVITKVNDDKVDSKHSLSTLIGKYKVGDSVKLTIIRDDKEQQVSLTLAELPQSWVELLEKFSWVNSKCVGYFINCRHCGTSFAGFDIS